MRYLMGLSLLSLAACGGPADDTAPAKQAADAPSASEAPAQAITAPAGEYRLDKSHANLVFRVDHLGFSHYTGIFADYDATLQFDPAAPENMSVEAVIMAPSLTVPAPPEGFHATLLGPDWFDADEYPQITFRSTKVTQTGPRKATVEGELTMLGVTAPVSMEAEFIGGYAGYPPYDPNARIGFSAHGILSRSDFGFTQGLPPEGSTMGVGDAVSFQIDAEFTGPPTPAEGE
ncbi:polyisoprenoid-binding protein [Marinicaulis flavus]|uniref:Polyisoprenoid-binding protein n=1 Tax=Hyphococcus luteus TaxID=2058213 RepID=A0A2S7K8J2_9PROT|nr:polyisoprenoid-binding protein [Marinicaulis flavus]